MKENSNQANNHKEEQVNDQVKKTRERSRKKGISFV